MLFGYIAENPKNKSILKGRTMPVVTDFPTARVGPNGTIPEGYASGWSVRNAGGLLKRIISCPLEVIFGTEEKEQDFLEKMDRIADYLSKDDVRKDITFATSLTPFYPSLIKMANI